jgi:hypothetical protein
MRERSAAHSSYVFGKRLVSPGVVVPGTPARQTGPSREVRSPLTFDLRQPSAHHGAGTFVLLHHCLELLIGPGHPGGEAPGPIAHITARRLWLTIRVKRMHRIQVTYWISS